MRQLSSFVGGTRTEVFVHLFQKVAGVQGAEPPAGIPLQSGKICRSKRDQRMCGVHDFCVRGLFNMKEKSSFRKTAPAVFCGRSCFAAIAHLLPLCGISAGDFAGALRLHPASF